jgi:hypothetical protein
VALKSGTATQLADRLRILADWGQSKRPPPDSALAQFVADARAYADHLANDLAPEAGGMVIETTTEVFRTADALAQGIIDEAGEPPTEGGGFPWLVVGLVLVGGAAAAYALNDKPRGRRVVLA